MRKARIVIPAYFRICHCPICEATFRALRVYLGGEIVLTEDKVIRVFAKKGGLAVARELLKDEKLSQIEFSVICDQIRGAQDLLEELPDDIMATCWSANASGATAAERLCVKCTPRLNQRAGRPIDAARTHYVCHHQFQRQIGSGSCPRWSDRHER